MDYICPTCGKAMPRDLLMMISHTEGHVVGAIKKKHPEWAESDGVCKKCYLYYKDQMKKKNK
ncbi:MAG: hypothetical protein COS99_08260 [Candidatus Omnitrophica bacterium CG07_land_8_20_14_0_80_42_15]|uniref:C2H2-type domain-containing protein n=1 Tax=Candidatus Aquitaenariimonas noxiae TaxID=1974741 RepID=A0A2J0L303_9BACT|nr:MAG: hypothetical protein COS99_08260 [Candidatus Omnitrophica bacterium CG07_land_8_20_14_0_80_42_15]